jgi:RNA polymerase sigma-54 factor
MALTPRLEMRQGQSLVMTPQLQQAIKLLQLSNLDLQAYVADELERNPLLEQDDREDRPDKNEVGEDRSEAADPDYGDANPEGSEGDTAAADIADGFDAPQDLVDSDLRLAEDAPPTEVANELDTGLENVFSSDSEADQKAATSEPMADMSTENFSSATSGKGALSEDYSIDQLGEQEISLRDFLTEQLNMTIFDPTHRLIAAEIIDSVNEAGYMGATIEGLADRLGASMGEIEKVLETLQTFEPSGVLARDLTECLRLQLKDKNRLDPAMDALLENLELLAKREIGALTKLCGVDEEDIFDMIAEIQELNPKPGLAHGGEVMQPVVPDVFVREKPDGGWHIELNNDTLPKVLVNARYYSQVTRAAINKDEKTYLNECLANANWLVKSLDQRAKTILKVSTEIVKQQDGFLVHGVEHLRPLNLRTVAEAIEMHESTVSRVTANKYMATPRGVFELKYFFTSSIAAVAGGEAHSAEAVRARLKALIENEDPKAVLSDDKLVELLKGCGIDIARRTVAKYREALRIPSSVQRRRQKKISA